MPDYIEHGGKRFVRIGSERGAVGFDGRSMRSAPKPLVLKGTMRTAADVALTSPEIRNPLLNIINFFLPYNYKVLNQWIRYYDRFHPMVGNCLDLHGSFPISKFDLKFESEDPEIRRVYENCVEEMDLFNRLLEMSREYELIGEVYPYLHWNDELNFWDAMIMLNPDYVQVKMHPLAYGVKPSIELEPDEMLKALVNSNEPEDIEIKQELDPIVIAAVMMGQNIKIDPYNVEQIARKASPYEPRGTSIVLRCLKDLLYEDKLREAQYGVADGMITPKIIWKLGDPANGYMPSQDDLLDFRTLLQSQAHDPLAAIVTHYGLELEYVGANGKILPIVPEFQFIEDRILTALYTNKALTHGEGPTYANATVAMEALQGRYLAKREKLEDFCERKIFVPVALANEFYEKEPECHTAGSGPWIRTSKKERKLNTPTLEWKQKLKLVEDLQKKQMIVNLRSKPIPEVSLKKIYALLDINYEDEITALREEGKIMKELKEIYGVQAPGAPPTNTPGNKPGAAPGEKPTTGLETKVPKSMPQQRLPGSPKGSTSVSAPKTPEPGSLKTKEPGTKMTGAGIKWNSKSAEETAPDEREKVLVALDRRSKLYSEDGKLKDPKTVMEELATAQS